MANVITRTKKTSSKPRKTSVMKKKSVGTKLVKKDTIKKAKIALGSSLALLAATLAAKKYKDSKKAMPFGWKSPSPSPSMLPMTKSKVSSLFEKLMRMRKSS